MYAFRPYRHVLQLLLLLLLIVTVAGNNDGMPPGDAPLRDALGQIDRGHAAVVEFTQHAIASARVTAEGWRGRALRVQEVLCLGFRDRIEPVLCLAVQCRIPARANRRVRPSPRRAPLR